MQKLNQRKRTENTEKHVHISAIFSSESSKLLKLQTSNFVHGFVLENPSKRINNFPQKGRGLGHVTPKMFGIRSNISSKLLEIQTSNLVRNFVLGKPSGRTNNFPRSFRSIITLGLHFQRIEKILHTLTGYIHPWPPPPLPPFAPAAPPDQNVDGGCCSIYGMRPKSSSSSIAYWAWLRRFIPAFASTEFPNSSRIRFENGFCPHNAIPMYLISK